MVSANSPSDCLPASSDRAGTAHERAYHNATLVSGIIAVALGACVIVGWLTDQMDWVQLGSDGPVMRFNTALLVMTAGSALIALALQRFILMRLLGAVLVVAAASTALQYLLRMNFGIDELFFKNLHTDVQLAGARMPVNSAVCFLLLGLAFVVMRSPERWTWRFFSTALLASAALAVSTVVIVGHAMGLTDALGWRGSYGMAIPTASGVAICATWLIVWAIRYQMQLGIPLSKWFPLIVGYAAVVGSFVLWHALEFQDSERIRHEVCAQFDALNGDLSYAFRHHEGVVMRMAKRWNTAGGTPETAWHEDAKNYLDALKGFKGLAWVDSNLEVQRVEETGIPNVAKMVAANDALRKTIKMARQRRVALAVIPGAQSPQEVNVWLCQPVLSNGTDDGCLLAVFNLHRLMPGILRRAPMPGQLITIRDHQFVLFESDRIPDTGEVGLTQTAELPFANLIWSITDTPSRLWAANRRSALPEVTVGAGLLLSFLVTTILQLAVWARESYHSAAISEARFRAIFSNAPLGISVVDDQGRFLQTNAHLQQILGFTEEQLRGKSFTEVTHPHDLDRTWTTYQELLAGKTASYQMELRSCRADGQTIWISVSCSALPKSENARLAIGMAMDITERKLAEARLALQYRVTRILSEDAATTDTVRQVIQNICELLDWDFSAVWVLDPNDSRVLRSLIVWQQPSLDTAGEFIFATRRLTFFSGQGLPGRVWETKQATWIEDVVVDANFPRAEVARKGGLHSAFAIPIQFHDKFHGVMEFFSREIRQPDQGLLDMMASLGAQLGQFFQRKSAERDLRETTALQEAILDGVNHTIISTTSDGVIRVFNKAAQELLGYLPEEVIGKASSDIIYSPDDNQAGKPKEHFQLAMKNGRWEGRLENVRKDGRQFPARLTVTPRFDVDGRILGYLLISTDLTVEQHAAQIEPACSAGASCTI